MWWKQRRPEIVEDFEREVFGRVPKNVPKVTWEREADGRRVVGGVPVIAKQLVGHVDNSAYPAINVDIQMTLVTPADAKGPVPVLMMFGGGGDACRARRHPEPLRRCAATGPADRSTRATHRRGLGLRDDQSRQHSGRQRRGPDAGHHRPRQQRPAAQAG